MVPRTGRKESALVQIIERILWGIAGLAALSIVGFLYAVGLPSSQPYIAMRPRQVEREVFQRLVAPYADVRKLPATPDSLPADEAFHVLNRELYQRVANRNDALRAALEADRVIKSRAGGGSVLLLRGFSEHSIFAKIGFLENDAIERINGRRIDFARLTRRQAVEIHEQIKSDFEHGQPLSVELTRNGKRTTLWFGFAEPPP